MLMAAMLFQDTGASGNTNLLITVFVGLVALSMVAQAVVLIALAVKASKAIKELTETVEGMKAKVLPLLATATQVALSAEAMVREAAPRVKTITENLVETSHLVRSTATQLNGTVLDANARTHRQIARVDSMVTIALTTTAEVVETINHGIRVPAQKIAVMAAQAKTLLEGFLDKAKGFSFGPKPTRSKAITRVDWQG